MMHRFHQEKEQNTRIITLASLTFYMPVKDGTYYGITRGVRADMRHPVLCLEHISRTVLPMVMKFCGWIDLIKGKCSAHES